MYNTVDEQLRELERDYWNRTTKRKKTMNQHERLSRSLRRFVVYPVGGLIILSALGRALEVSIALMLYGSLLGEGQL